MIITLNQHVFRTAVLDRVSLRKADLQRVLYIYDMFSCFAFACLNRDFLTWWLFVLLCCRSSTLFSCIRGHGADLIYSRDSDNPSRCFYSISVCSFSFTVNEVISELFSSSCLSGLNWAFCQVTVSRSFPLCYQTDCVYKKLPSVLQNKHPQQKTHDEGSFHPVLWLCSRLLSFW